MNNFLVLLQPIKLKCLDKMKYVCGSVFKGFEKGGAYLEEILILRPKLGV